MVRVFLPSRYLQRYLAFFSSKCAEDRPACIFGVECLCCIICVTCPISLSMRRKRDVLLWIVGWQWWRCEKRFALTHTTSLYGNVRHITRHYMASSLGILKFRTRSKGIYLSLFIGFKRLREIDSFSSTEHNVSVKNDFVNLNLKKSKGIVDV